MLDNLGDKKVKYISPHGGTVTALPTGQSYHRDKSRFRLIVGPFGSGKSVINVQEIFRLASHQAPGPDGVRRSRWLVVRNTYPQLKDATIKTWLQWFPEAKFGKFNFASPPHHNMKWFVEDKEGRRTKVECEVLFRALDRPDQVSNLLSVEITGAFINECRDVPKVIFDAITGRINRYPASWEGGATWSGVIMDTNPFDTDHYLYDLFEVQRLKGYRVWHQAGEENAKNLPTNYYSDLSLGKDPEWVRIYIGGEYGFICDGQQVYPDFNHNSHVSEESLVYNPNSPIIIGVDFGLTPAMVWTQIDSRGRWLILHEEIVESTKTMGIERFATHCMTIHNIRFPKSEIRVFADPAGTQRVQTDEKTCYEVMREIGFRCEPGAIDFTSRREAVDKRLRTLIDGKPALLIAPHLKYIPKGFLGGYHYPEIQGKIKEKPEKNIYSHVHDALQYAATGVFYSYADRRKRRGKKRKAIPAMVV